MRTLMGTLDVVVFGRSCLLTSVLINRLDDSAELSVRAHVDRPAALWDTLAAGGQADAVVISVTTRQESTQQNSTAIVRQLRTAYPGIRVVVAGDFQAADTLPWIEAGATHVTLADEPFEKLHRVLRGNRDGDCSAAFVHQIAGRIQNLRRLQEATVTASRPMESVAGKNVADVNQGQPFDIDAARSLTRREEQVARLVAQGLLNKQIAKRLELRLTTVKTHVRNVLKKLKAGTRRDILDRLVPSFAEAN